LTRQFLHELNANPDHVRIIWAHGLSMEPTIIHGDMLLVDTAQTDPRVGGIFVFREREWLHVKRVKISARDGSIMFGSDNPEYGPFAPEALEGLAVLGRVVWIGRRPR
jgi:phage repressor protein C with HTH and peptisase S24 domain